MRIRELENNTGKYTQKSKINSRYPTAQNRD